MQLLRSIQSLRTYLVTILEDILRLEVEPEAAKRSLSHGLCTRDRRPGEGYYGKASPLASGGFLLACDRAGIGHPECKLRALQGNNHICASPAPG